MGSSRRLTIAVAALAAVLAGCGGAPASNVGSSPSVAPPADTPSPPATGAPSPSASEVVVPQLPVQACCAELALEPGAYALPGWLGPLLRLETSGDWNVINDASARYLAFGRGENSVGTMASLVTVLGTPIGTTSDEVVAALTSTPELELAGDPVTFQIAGFDATELRATAAPNPDRTDDPDADISAGTIDLDALEPFVEPGFRLTTSTAEAALRFLILEVDDRVLIAWAEAPAAESDAFFADVDTLLGTLGPQ
jgi:hypothetical protein